MQTLFQASSLLVMPFWFLMIFLPRWRWTTKIVNSPLVIVAPAVLYSILVLPRFLQIFPLVVNPSLAGIATLLASPAGATIAWVHFLAFDLFAGRWIFLDSRKRQLSPVLMVPVLFFTLMLGPFGFLLYMLVRLIRTTAAEKPSPMSAVGRAMATNPPLAFIGGLMVLTVVATLIGVAVDHRVMTGVPLWLKPAKFAMSVCVYCFTFAWLLSYVKIRPKLARWVGNVTAVSLLVEMIAIVGQAARGTTSHFNISTGFDSFVWIVMAVFITLVFAAGLLLAILLIQQDVPDRAFAWSLRLGVILSLMGMAVAFFMVTPSTQQLQVIAEHTGPAIAGAHSVGVPDGGPGLPFLNWSAVGGDLRVSHFVGLHALQVLPFIGWFLMKRKTLGEGFKIKMVWISAVAYLGVILLLLWQALRGESIIHPDNTILTAALTLAGLTVVAAGAVLVFNGRRGVILPEAKLMENKGSI